MAPLEISYDGFWGKPTATIDWCEANYEVTHYIAEFCEYFTKVSTFLRFLTICTRWHNLPVGACRLRGTLNRKYQPEKSKHSHECIFRVLLVEA